MNLKPFQQAERDFFLLKGQLATNRLTRAQFDAALAKLGVRDEYGRVWRMDAESGAWSVKTQDTWLPADPATYPPPAPRTERSPQHSDPARERNGVRSLLPLLALGTIFVVCLCGVAAFAGLYASGVLSAPLNLFRTATPTVGALLATATPSTPATATLSPPPTSVVVDDTAVAPPTQPAGTVLPTPESAQTYVAFDADFFADACPLFEGSNETREYGCDFGEYYMLHKQATTRYAYYDAEYADAVVEATGYFNKGSGKYEYGVVFRGNTDGTAYYVFTVTQDGKYNVARYQNEKYTDLIPYTASPIVKTGTGANHFKIITRGDRFDFYLNDQYLGNVTDAALPRGIIGLFFYNAEPNTEVGFDRLTISTFIPPTPTATPNPNATATNPAADSAVIFTDDFAVGCNLFEGDNETRAYKCQNGEYAMLHKTNAGRWSVYDEEYTDGVFESDGHLVLGSGTYEYGLVVRARDNPWTFYALTVTHDGKYSAFLYKDDKYTDLIPYTASSAVKSGSAVNRFRIIAQGDQLRFYLNDQYLGAVSDANLAQGSPGFYLSNKEPNVQVAFDNVRISTLNQAQGTPTSASVAPTAEPTAAPTKPLKPGVYVNSLRLSPGAPKRGAPVTFTATFVNATGKTQSFRWFVEIWEQDPNKRNPYGQADGLVREIPVGTHERVTGDSWKVAGGGPCVSFRARVVYQDDQSRRIPFTRTNGAELWLPFQVCP